MTPKAVRIAVLAVLATVLAATAAIAAKPNPPQGQLSVTLLDGKLSWGSGTALNGQLTATSPVSGMKVTLQQDPFPFDKFTNVSSTTTDAQGNYGFLGVKPTLNTRYRAVADTKPKSTSSAATALVRPKVTLSISDRTPAKDTKITLSGSVWPAHDGRQLLIQRRTSSGWKTVNTVTLADAGADHSAFSLRRTAKRDVSYRARLAAHDDHIAGFSRRKSVDVH
jgi:hypothetical protein